MSGDSLLINRHVANTLVGKKHGSGTFTAYEESNGRVFMVSTCSNCGAPKSGISMQNASFAYQHADSPVIVCGHGCKHVAAQAAKPTLEQVLAIPEWQRTSEQQKIVIEAEFAANAAAAKKVKDAPMIAARERVAVADNRELFIQHERLLLAIGINIHGTGYSSTRETREVLSHPTYLSLAAFKQLDEAQRSELNDIVDRQLNVAGQSKFLVER